MFALARGCQSPQSFAYNVHYARNLYHTYWFCDKETSLTIIIAQIRNWKLSKYFKNIWRGGAGNPFAFILIKTPWLAAVNLPLHRFSSKYFQPETEIFSRIKISFLYNWILLRYIELYMFTIKCATRLNSQICSNRSFLENFKSVFRETIKSGIERNVK